VLLGAFDRSRVEAVLIAPGPGLLVDRVRALGVPVEFGAPTRKLAFGEAGRLARTLAGRFDIVHAHGPRASFWTARAARRAGVKFVATIHELRWTTLPPGPRRALWVGLEDAALRRADHLIAVSRTVRDAVTGRHPEWAKRMSVVYGSTPLLVNPGPLVPRRRASGLRIVSIGRLDWVKGLDVLLDALADLSRRGIEFSADIAGRGPLGSALRQQSSRLGLESRVRWHEDEVDVAGLLSGSDVFVTATRFETFGMAALEAMTFGLPVVAPAIGGLAEVVSSEAGILVDPEPRASLPGRLAEGLARLAADPALRDRLGARGAQDARERFGPEALARGVETAYRNVLGLQP
jgi:glycosyltransferase involved in cell wall biosynthesis